MVSGVPGRYGAVVGVVMTICDVGTCQAEAVVGVYWLPLNQYEVWMPWLEVDRLGRPVEPWLRVCQEHARECGYVP